MPGERRHKWFAALYDRMSRSEERRFFGEMREHLLSGLTGDVLEIGAGTGLNFEHYPPEVRVTAIEPDPFMLARARDRLDGLGRASIRLQQAPAESLPFEDASFDAIVSTLVLCTVGDVPRALAEMRRVLRPGGELRFIEHVRGRAFVGRMQDIIEPVWGYFGAGCHPNRRTVETIRDAGWDVTITDQSKAIMLGFVPLREGRAVPVAAPVNG